MVWWWLKGPVQPDDEKKSISANAEEIAGPEPFDGQILTTAVSSQHQLSSKQGSLYSKYREYRIQVSDLTWSTREILQL